MGIWETLGIEGQPYSLVDFGLPVVICCTCYGSLIYRFRIATFVFKLMVSILLICGILGSSAGRQWPLAPRCWSSGDKSRLCMIESLGQIVLAGARIHFPTVT